MTDSPYMTVFVRAGSESSVMRNVCLLFCVSVPEFYHATKLSPTYLPSILCETVYRLILLCVLNEFRMIVASDKSETVLPLPPPASYNVSFYRLARYRMNDHLIDLCEIIMGK